MENTTLGTRFVSHDSLAIYLKGLEGYVDEVRIYNRSLSDAEISSTVATSSAINSGTVTSGDVTTGPATSISITSSYITTNAVSSQLVTSGATPTSLTSGQLSHSTTGLGTHKKFQFNVKRRFQIRKTVTKN